MGEGVNGEAILAILGLVGLFAVVLTGAVWDTPVVTVPLRWLMS
jgi:hypothetical protein